MNLDDGDFIGERVKIATPKPATPDAVAEVVAEILRQEEWDGPVGIALPSVIREQVALSAANIDPSWIGTNVHELFHLHLGEGREVSVLNDADAAGLAEVSFGEPAAARGAVIFLTFGTGIGSAFLTEGRLFPNSELGHLIVDGEEAAVQAANDTPYGLVSYVYSGDLARGLRTGERLEAGMVAVNRTKVTGAPIPFGGMKQSGLAREGSRHGLEAFTDIKYVCRDWSE